MLYSLWHINGIYNSGTQRFVPQGKGRSYMDPRQYALEKHAEWHEKLSVESKAPITDREELAVAYTPGVAEPCLKIAQDESLAYKYTGKGNTGAEIIPPIVRNNSCEERACNHKR